MLIVTMSNRTKRAQIAAETIEILESGKYVSPENITVSIGDSLTAAQQGTVLYTPISIDELIGSLLPSKNHSTSFEVINTTTFTAARQLIDQGYRDPLCLNFASAKNPGGGFIGGSQAQEECLARASGLYPCLQKQMSYYNANRHCGTALYTNHIIYSPQVPIFRDDQDELLLQPALTSIITSPAVNKGAVEQNEPQNIDRLKTTMQHRIHSVLAIARQHGHRSLVLGAWGCGVFKNDPQDIAQWFYAALTVNPLFSGAFERVVFAVFDRSKTQENFRAFHNVFTP
jgi:uncharacterized protein (TIGR02452 family)